MPTPSITEVASLEPLRAGKEEEEEDEEEEEEEENEDDFPS